MSHKGRRGAGLYFEMQLLYLTSSTTCKVLPGERGLELICKLYLYLFLMNTYNTLSLRFIPRFQHMMCSTQPLARIHVCFGQGLSCSKPYITCASHVTR